MISLDEMRKNIEDIKEELTLAQNQVEEDTKTKIEILPVSKFHPVEAILMAKELGFNCFAENRVQELLTKLEDPRLADCQFDLIGSLQTNKLKSIVGKVRLIHSLDRESLLNGIEKYAAALNLKQEVLLQVNYSMEDSKHGIGLNELPSFVDKILSCPHVALRGMMTMAAPGINEAEQERFFKSFKALFDKTRKRLPKEFMNQFNVLSMGMSDDYKAAIRNGSSCIRLGRSIFGARD